MTKFVWGQKPIKKYKSRNTWWEIMLDNKFLSFKKSLIMKKICNSEKICNQTEKMCNRMQISASNTKCNLSSLLPSIISK